MEFKSIFKHVPRPAVINPDSEVKQDESLTISQIISLHLRGIPAPVHVYDSVEYEIGDSKYRDEQLNEDYYELENDLSDFNQFVSSSCDSYLPEVQRDARADGDRSRSDTNMRVTETLSSPSASMSSEGNVVNNEA